MEQYFLVTIAFAVFVFIEGTRANIPRDTLAGWAVAVALLGPIALPLWLWWRARWNRQHGIVVPQPTSPADSTSWKRLALYFVLGIVVLGVLSVWAIASQ